MAMGKRERPLRRDYLLLSILAAPALLLLFTIGRYYGYYYDNKFFNLLTLELWERFRLYLYLGSHYHVPSSIFSYLAYPFFLLLGPGDLPLELLAAIFHIVTVYFSFRLGERFHGRSLGLLFALFAGLGPIHLIQVYTLPDLSFAIFLNISAVYYFLTGSKDLSRQKLVLGAVLYSLGCFQAIYSLLLFPFFIFYSFAHHLGPSDGCRVKENQARPRGSQVVAALFFIAAIPAYTYIYLLFKFTFMRNAKSAFLMLLLPAAILLTARIRRRSARVRSGFQFLFVLVTLALLSYFDLIVQIDYYFFDHSFGYFLDATRAGGYGGRPPVRYMGTELFIHGVPIYMSVLTSVYEFAGSSFAKSSFNLDALKHLYSSYFVVSYPLSVRVFFFIGLISVAAGSVKRFIVEKKFPLFYIYPLVWCVAASAPLIDLGPDYYNIRRVYILPLPYIFTAFGVLGIAATAATVAEWAGLCSNKGRVAVFFSVALAVFISADQMKFSVKNIFQKYTHDKEESMFFKLFYGHYYGRSYKEVGDFLLKDMPPKKDGIINSVLIYSIPEDTPYGRALPLFNTVNWYTNNRIRTVCDFKDKSIELYGTPQGLINYLDSFFKPDPNVAAVYVADYVDEEDRNFSVFSRLYPRLKPYAVVDDDGVKRFDVKLFKFERESWKEKLREAGYGQVSVAVVP